MAEPLTIDEQAELAVALEHAQGATAGDVLCAVSDEASTYRGARFAVSAGLGAALPTAAFLAGIHPLSLREALAGWGVGVHPFAEPRFWLLLGLYALAVGAFFVGVLTVVSKAKVRRALTPRWIERNQVRKVAERHFASHSRAAGVPGVEVFASVHERYVVIVADDAVLDRVGRDPLRIVARAATDEMRARGPAEALVLAVRAVGDLMTCYFPLGETPAQPPIAA